MQRQVCLLRKSHSRGAGSHRHLPILLHARGCMQMHHGSLAWRMLQVTELAAAVHRLSQDKCQLENQMEMEEVRQLCWETVTNLCCVQQVHTWDLATQC